MTCAGRRSGSFSGSRALKLLLDQLAQRRLVAIDELARVEVAAAARDDLLHDRKLILVHRVGRDRSEIIFGAADLVGVAHRIAEQPGAERTQRDGALLAVDHDPSDRDFAALAQRLANDAIAFLGDAAVGHEVVRRVEIDRIDVVDEFGDVDRIGRLEPQPLDVVRIDSDVAALFVLVPLDDVLALDRADPGHHELLLDPLAGRLVDHVEAHLVALGRGGVEPHRDRDQRQLDKTGPVGSRRRGHRMLP